MDILTRKDCLDEAARCVLGKREQDYGSPESNFETISLLWGVYLRSAHPDLAKVLAVNGISATDVAMMMALLKIARIATGTGTGDSFADLAGYAACGCEVAMMAQKRQTVSRDNITPPSIAREV